MQNQDKVSLSIGDIVTATYKTGEYIGELTELSSPRGVVKILAVIKHPTQGDLHQLYEADVAMFHQRKALAYTEKALVPLSAIHPYSGSIPGYKESLQKAVQLEMEMLSRTGDWARRALEQLEELKKDYTF
ncbi:kinase [Paenibacillus swuensis]|uniref:Kinase n=1 Tax=Paenibacillus swuensis TaxID=1178515 RepID=A0A172TIV5_9BACL|nr:kinase-associated lipoprotein B [Paenibacillus swuensis]ANE46999.1 kinase [Paenibacillus swuensis]